MNLRWYLFLFICVSAVVLVVADMAFDLRSEQIAAIIPLLALLAVTGSSTLRNYMGQGHKVLLHIVIWLAIGSAVALVGTLFPNLVP